MRSEKAITIELNRIKKKLWGLRRKEYFDFLYGAEIGILWTAGLNGLRNKNKSFPRPTAKWRSKAFLKEEELPGKRRKQ